MTTNEDERALLEAASTLARTNLGDFIRRKALDAAEADTLERRIVTIPGQGPGSVRGLGEPSAGGDCRAQGPRAHGANVAEVTRPRPLSETDDHIRDGHGERLQDAGAHDLAADDVEVERIVRDLLSA